MKYLNLLTAILGCCVVVSHANASETPPGTDLVTESVIAELKELADNPLLRSSITTQNSRLGSMTESRILELDKQWRAERDAAIQTLIAPTMSSPLSGYLTQVQAHSTGLYTEIIVMDANGLNVGQSNVTSDFWQGDEAKFTKTYPVGPDAVFVDEAELHEGTMTHRAQVNLTITDAARSPIGAMTVELNLTELQRRAAFTTAQ